MKDFIIFYKELYNKNIVNKLISINIIIFALQSLFSIEMQTYFMMPSSLKYFIFQPWSLISSMFMHSGYMHILFNMLWLWQMGKILLNEINDEVFLKLYMYGGIGASIGVVIYSHIFNIETFMLGASGAISVIIFSAIYTYPNRLISFFGFFNLKMKHIAWLLMFYNIIGLSGDNAGGSVAHLTGSIIGYIWIKNYLKRDILKDVFNIL